MFSIGPLQQFSNNYLFFKFINKYQKQILRCAPPSSHVCDFLAMSCGSVNYKSWKPLNYKTYSRLFQDFKHYLYLCPFNLFSFKESSILTIKYVFSFFWYLNCTRLVCKLYLSIRSILDYWAVLMFETFYSDTF